MVGKRAVAKVVSDVGDPIVLVVGVVVVVAVHGAGLARGLGLAAAMGTVLAGIPYAVLRLGMRSGRFGGRHVPDRGERPVLLLTGAACVVAALTIGRALDAPRELLALVAAMLAGATVTLLITLFWKISMHAGVAAGTLVSLVVVLGPWVWLAAPLVGLIGWARLALHVHTPAQVVAGTIVGGGVAAAVMLPLLG